MTPEIASQTPVAGLSWLWAVRLAAIVLGLGIWYVSQAWLARRVVVTPSAGELGDTVHHWTRRMHRGLQERPRLTNGLLAGSSLAIDLLGIWLLASAVFGPSFGPGLGMILIFALRQVVQFLCPLPPPRGMLWRDPGFPTLLVTYGTDNDLFFSGHTALAVYGAMCLATAFGPAGVVLGAGLVVFEIVVVLILRAHYTMDVFAGAVTALYVHYLSGQLAPAVDHWLAALVS